MNMMIVIKADSRSAPSQWETALLCNDVSHWLCASLESALVVIIVCFQAASDPVLTDDQTAELTGLMNSKDKDKNVTIPVSKMCDMLRTKENDQIF